MGMSYLSEEVFSVTPKCLIIGTHFLVLSWDVTGYQFTLDFISEATSLFVINFSKLATLSTFEHVTAFPVGCRWPLSSGQSGTISL